MKKNAKVLKTPFKEEDYMTASARYTTFQMCPGEEQKETVLDIIWSS